MWGISPLLNLAIKYNIAHRSYVQQAFNSMIALANTEICAQLPSRALVIGVHSDEDNRYDEGVLTPSGYRYNVNRTDHRLLEMVRMAGPIPKRGECRILVGVETVNPFYSLVAITGLGRECLGFNPYEVLDEQKESIRRGVAKACMELAIMEVGSIQVESCGHAESAAEGAILGVWAYQALKDPRKRLHVPAVELYAHKDEPCDIEGWRIGIIKGTAQNFTRQLQETPPNMLTPTGFAKMVVEELCKSGVNVEVKVEGWAESQSMQAFLAVAKASCEPPIFIELSYYGTNPKERPIVLVGQGITYDTGGLCVKPDRQLETMRGDMTGAAVVVATCRAVAALRLPVNIRGLIPLCESMLGCNSFRSGDVVKSMNGKYIEVQGTDHEDMMVLADALIYAQNFCPRFTVDIGTCSRGMHAALGEAACGAFTNSEILWQQIKMASMHTGDRVWRMPLFDFYTRQVTAGGTDVQNYGSGRGGGPCKAAAFLKEFMPCGQWMHIDATSVMYTAGRDFEYLREGMAGRPTRTLVEFIAQSICVNTAPKFPSPKKTEPTKSANDKK